MALAIHVACAKRDLDRQTAMRLLQGRTVAAKWLLNPNFPCPFPPGYLALARAGMITCYGGDSVKEFCFCGDPSGDVRAPSGTDSDFLELVVGSLSPSEITHMSKTGGDITLADVRLSFRPTPFYANNRRVLDQIDGLHRLPLEATHDRMAKATFRRLADGWHFETIQ